MSGAMLLGAAILVLVAAFWRLRVMVDPRGRLEPRPAASPLGDPSGSRFGRGLAMQNAAHPGLSGVHLIEDPLEAFAARVQLIRGADIRVDLQYYIWHPDVAGTLLIAELLAAAQRGVAVRLLLDDNGTGGLDAMLRALEAHANIEVRLFNPFIIRWPKGLGYLLDFSRLNRRMHNKSLTADGLLTIVGGRNIGDEYLGASDKLLFADLDVLAIGAVVGDVAMDFERYWRSRSAYLAPRILGTADDDALAELAATVAATAATPLGQRYAEAAASGVVDQLLSDAAGLEWAKVTLVSDDPAKGLGAVRDAGLLATRLAAVVGEPAHTLGLVSAYFVPTRALEAMLAAMARRGVAIDVLTNALKANDVAIVHAGYGPCRAPLLAAGVRLWELKGADPSRRARLRFRGGSASGARSGGGGGNVGGTAPKRGRRGRAIGPVFRTSRSALHAKTFTIDRRRLFVGSFNFDPRSLHLNTEMGFVIESPLLAARLQDMFGADVEGAAYQVRLAGGDRLEWIERGDDGEVVHAYEPGTGPLQRLILRGLEWLPVKWLL